MAQSRIINQSHRDLYCGGSIPPLQLLGDRGLLQVVCCGQLKLASALEFSGLVF